MIIIESLINIIAFIMFIGLVLWIGLILFKIIAIKSKRNKDKKEILKLLDGFEVKFKYVYKIIFMVLGIILNMVVATILAIGSEPIIYEINQPFVTKGYATFASYIVAIGIFFLLPKWFSVEQRLQNE